MEATAALTWIVTNTQCVPSLTPTITIPDQAGGTGFTLTSANAGIVFLAPQTTGASVINIPTAANNTGLHYTIICTGTIARNMVVTPAGGAFYGMLGNFIAAGWTGVTCANNATVTIDAVAIAGTRLDLYRDGTRWICSGISNVDDAWT